MAYDKKCYELAEHFTPDITTGVLQDRQKLAQHIQDAIEEWLAGIANDPAPAKR